MSAYEERLRAIAASAVTAARKPWNPLLHPRARDGRFIEKGGWLRGLFRLADGRTKMLNGRVLSFSANQRDPNDVVVNVMTKHGEMSTTVSQVYRAVEPKASLAERVLPWVKSTKDVVNRNYSKEMMPFEQAIARVNAAAAELSTTDPRERARQLDKIMSGVRGTPLSTVVQENKRGKSRDEWDAVRAAQHEALWEDFIDRVRRAGIPQERRALALGGLPGAGKSTSLQPGQAAGRLGVVGWDTLGEPPEGVTHVVLNPDTIKELMIDAGMLPKGISPNIKPLEQVSFIHAESNFITALFFSRLAGEGYNVVYDTTMANVPHVKKNLKPLRDAGYSFQGLFVDISYEESRLSAAQRYIDDWDSPRGGRFVPSEAGAARSGRGFRSYNRDVFQDMTEWFDEWMVVDNTGVSRRQAKGEVVAEGKGLDPALQAWRDQQEARRRAAGTSQSWQTRKDPAKQEALSITEQYMRLAQEAGRPVTAAAPVGMPWMHLAWRLRDGSITPEDAVEQIRNGLIHVADETGDDPDDYLTASTLPHEFMALGREDLLEDLGEAVDSARRSGLTMAAPITAATLPRRPRKPWNELLHPRGRDGKFIRKGGWIMAMFDLPDGTRKPSRAKVVRLQENINAPSDPLIHAELSDGTKVTTTASKATAVPMTKAELNAAEADFKLAVSSRLKKLADLLQANAPGPREIHDLLDSEMVNLGGDQKPTEFMKAVELAVNDVGRALDDEVMRRVHDIDGAKFLTAEEWKAADEELQAKYGAWVEAVHKRDAELAEIYGDQWMSYVATDPEAQALVEQGKALSEARAKLDNNRRGFRAAYAARAQEVLSTVVELGGPVEFDIYKPNPWDKTDAKFLSPEEEQALRLRVAESVGTVYPTAWLQASNSLNPPVSVSALPKRSYYSFTNGHMALPVDAGVYFRQVALHEFGHRMEHAVPALKALEWAFYHRRTEGEPKISLQKLLKTKAYGAHEFVRPDKFSNPYMGKEYGGGHTDFWEIFTMGVELMMATDTMKGQQGITKLFLEDTDYRSFILGVLATVKPPQQPAGEGV